MKFVVAANLPPDLANWLTQREQDAIPVRKLGVQGVPDDAIWTWAIDNNAIIITKDFDFPSRRARLAEGPRVVWLRIGNSTKPVLFSWMETAWPQILAELNAGSGVVEVRRS